jgi:hypothetical protein
MATFEAQVSGVTGLIDAFSSSTNPKDTELDQFLKDGVLDVTNRVLQMRPQDIELFARTTSSDTNGVNVGGARIISVMREANASGASDGSTAWRPCKKIPAALQSRVVDTDSLYFASIYNPVYIQESDKTINVYPVPSGNNGMKILYVNEEPRDITNNAALVHSHSNIKYFPNDKVYLVVLYAAIAALEAKLGEYTIDEEDIELVQAIQVIIASLKQKYDTAFSLMAPKQAAQPQGQPA